MIYSTSTAALIFSPGTKKWRSSGRESESSDSVKSPFCRFSRFPLEAYFPVTNGLGRGESARSVALAAVTDGPFTLDSLSCGELDRSSSFSLCSLGDTGNDVGEFLTFGLLADEPSDPEFLSCSSSACCTSSSESSSGGKASRAISSRCFPRCLARAFCVIHCDFRQRGHCWSKLGCGSTFSAAEHIDAICWVLRSVRPWSRRRCADKIESVGNFL